MLKSLVEGLLELHFIWQCAGFWMSLLEQTSDCSVWVTVPTDFPQIVLFFTISSNAKQELSLLPGPN